MDIINYARTALGWSEPSVSTTAGGSSHARIFTATARLSAASLGTHASALTTAPSKRLAEHQALSMVLASLAGEPSADLFPSASPPPSPDVPAPAAQSMPTHPGENPKGRLLELCQKRRWAPPTFSVDRSGAAHIPTFSATATINPPDAPPITSAAHFGPTRKAAEQAAADRAPGRGV